MARVRAGVGKGFDGWGLGAGLGVGFGGAGLGAGLGVGFDGAGLGARGWERVLVGRAWVGG